MNIKNSKIASIIIPVYKIEEQFLRECLNSVSKLLNQRVEIILVDDGSPDNCGAICDEYALKDKRFFSYHKKNDGVSVARNYGLCKATAKWITFIDADDWIEPAKMDSILEQLENYNEDIVYYGEFINYYNKEPSVIKPFSGNKKFYEKEDIERLKKMVLVRDFNSMKSNYNSGVIVNTVCKFVKKIVLDKNKINFNPNISIHEDALFNLTILTHCNSAAYIDICAYHYRMRKTSACHSKLGYGYSEIKNFYNIILEFQKKYPQSKDFRIAVYYRCYDLIFENMESVFQKNIINKKDIIKNSILFQKELKRPPLKKAIKIVRFNMMSRKGKIKLLLLKLHLGWMFFIISTIKYKYFNSKKGELF